MAVRTPGERRAEFIARARIAIRKGVGQAEFLRQAKAGGFSLRRQRMQGEWRNITGLEEKKDRFRYVRKDRMPTAAVISQVDWNLSQEYMYVLKMKTQARPGATIFEQNINVMADRPLTPGEVELLAWEMVSEQPPEKYGRVIALIPWAAVQRIS